MVNSHLMDYKKIFVTSRKPRYLHDFERNILAALVVQDLLVIDNTEHLF